jgi:Zn-dependent protease/CBS domain-containing protein
MNPENYPVSEKKPVAAGAVGLFRIFGVPIRFHFTFVLLLVFLIVLGFSGRQSAAVNVAYILALFTSVLLHELGHAVVARRHGVKTIEIVMYPIGGLARLDRALKAREELWIALAGPAVNFVIAGALFAYLAAQNALVGPRELFEATDANLLERIAAGNLLLAVFNLLPAYPMDGGRVLRSIVARFRTEDDATRIAARTGRIFAGFMGLYGLLSANFMLVFIAFFVYLGATQESSAVEGRSLTQGMPVRAAMITDFRTLSHGETIRDAANLLIATSQQDFPVVLGERVIGLLGRAALVKAMVTEGPDAYLSGVIDRQFVALAPDEDLAEALPKLAEAGACALVMDNDRLVGLLTAENVSEFLLLRRIGIIEPRPDRTLAK